MTSPTQQPDGVTLDGLDGSNPLAFLAALGALRTLTIASKSPDAPNWLRSGVTMDWRQMGVRWTPALHTPANETADSEALLAAIDRGLVREIEEHPLSALANRDNLHSIILDSVQRATAQTRDDGPDWLSALCSDLAPDATSRLQTVRRDNLFRNLKSIMQRTEPQHLRRALFTPWDYADALNNQSLHIEPTEDRRHAHQWHKPSGDPTRSKRGGMLGANRLAIEAFPLFQSFASGDKLSTTGFTGQRANNTRWTWPLWSCRLGCNEIASLLALPDLQAEAPDAQRLRARGIISAFRCRHILVEKTPNFTPAVAVF